MHVFIIISYVAGVVSLAVHICMHDGYGHAVYFLMAPLVLIVLNTEPLDIKSIVQLNMVTLMCLAFILYTNFRSKELLVLSTLLLS